MAKESGEGSATAKRGNAKAEEGKKNVRTSSAAQSELGKKGCAEVLTERCAPPA